MVDVSRHHELPLRPSDLEVDWLHRDDLFDRQRVLQGARREAALIETAARTRADQLLAETAELAEEWLAEIDDECERLLGGAALDDAEAAAARLRAGAADDVAALWQTAEAEVATLRQQTDDELTELWETAERELDALLDEARHEATAIVDTARAEAEQIRAQAHEELAEVRAAVEKLRNGLDELLASAGTGSGQGIETEAGTAAPAVEPTVAEPSADGPMPDPTLAATPGPIAPAWEPAPVGALVASAASTTPAARPARTLPATGSQHRPWSRSIRRLLTARR